MSLAVKRGDEAAGRVQARGSGPKPSSAYGHPQFRARSRKSFSISDRGHNHGMFRPRPSRVNSRRVIVSTSLARRVLPVIRKAWVKTWDLRSTPILPHFLRNCRQILQSGPDLVASVRGSRAAARCASALTAAIASEISASMAAGSLCVISRSELPGGAPTTDLPSASGAGIAPDSPCATFAASLDFE